MVSSTKIQTDRPEHSPMEWPPPCLEAHHGITGEGPLAQGGLMFVGQAPGRDEVKTGHPFTGPSGRLLNALLKSIGVERDNIYITNVCCFRPTWGDHGGDREPSPAEIEECLPRLLREIAVLKPRLIVLLGLTPARVLYPERTGGTRGGLLWSKQFETWMLQTHHPAFILRNNNEDKDEAQDL